MEETEAEPKEGESRDLSCGGLDATLWVCDSEGLEITSTPDGLRRLAAALEKAGSQPCPTDSVYTYLGDLEREEPDVLRIRVVDSMEESSTEGSYDTAALVAMGASGVFVSTWLALTLLGVVTAVRWLLDW